jgi:hypothetical protein
MIATMAGKLQLFPTAVPEGPPLRLICIKEIGGSINVDLAFRLYWDRFVAGPDSVVDYVPIEQRPDGVSVSGR